VLPLVVRDGIDAVGGSEDVERAVHGWPLWR
jgi:hypothetical protein